jgi:hypothetical protein
MYRKLISFIVLLSFISCFVGCTTMRYVPREDIFQVEQKSRVWVTLADGMRYEIQEPKIEGSKLVGYVEGEGHKEINLSEIGFLEVKELDKRKTVKLVAIGLTGGIVLIWALSSGDSDEPPCPT